MKCASCGNDCQIGNAFCGKCGASLPQEGDSPTQSPKAPESFPLEFETEPIDDSGYTITPTPDATQVSDTGSPFAKEAGQSVVAETRIGDVGSAAQPPPPKPPVRGVITKIAITLLLCILGFIASMALTAFSIASPSNTSALAETVDPSAVLAAFGAGEDMIRAVLNLLFSIHPFVAASILCVFFLVNILLLNRTMIRTAFLSIGIPIMMAGLNYIVASLLVGMFPGAFGDAAYYIRAIPGITGILLIPGLILLGSGALSLAVFLIISAAWKNRPLAIPAGKSMRVWRTTGIIANCVLLVALSAFVLLCYLDAGKASAFGARIPEMYDGPTKIEVFHHKYRDDIAVIDQDAYSFVEREGSIIVTIHHPNDDIRKLSVGETFVFEPSSQNPEGLAGNIVGIVDGGDSIVISARLPEALDEIFDELEIVGDINLLADAVEIKIDEELAGVDGIEFARNPTRLFEANFTDANVGGMTLNGRLTMFTPRLNMSLGLRGVNHLVVTMAAETNINASSQLDVDKVISLFTIPVSFYYVSIDVPVGLRIKANGQGFLEFDCRVDAQFGIRNNKASAQVNVTKLAFNYHYSAKVELTVNVQAKARVLYVPTYAIQGDFGMGARTDSEMQKMCPKKNCVVIGLYHVRQISSLDWGALGWIPALQFNVNLVSDGITNYRYLSNGRWSNNCPHGGDAPTADVPSAHPPQFDDFSHLGSPVTLEEAQRTSGLYIKDGDGFILIKSQWSMESGGWSTYHLVSDVAMAIRGMNPGSTSASVLLPILFDADYSIPKVPNNAQFVIIGITDVAIYEVYDDGWTIPVGLSLWDESIRNPGGWWSSPANSLLSYRSGSGMISWEDQKFEEINGEAPTNYVSRMLYTGYRFNLASTNGILPAAFNEQFTFSWMEGTNWREATYTADKRFYLLPIDEGVAIRANYEIVETREGYFEVEFLTPPLGYCCTGGRVGAGPGGFNNIIEFVAS